MNTQTWIKFLYVTGIFFGQVLAQGKPHPVADCRTSPGDLKVKYDIEFKVSCRHPCVKANSATIWGSVQYTYDSSICKSALHDNRISAWNTSQRTVDLIRRKVDLQMYYGSINQKVRSVDWGKLTNPTDGYFFFVSPKISEPLLDVTSVSRNFLTSDSSNVFQECHLGSSARASGVTFEYYLPYFQDSRNPPVLPPNTSVGVRAGSGYNEWVSVAWNLDPVGIFIPGGLWCRINQSSYSNVLSLSMAKGADFFPVRWTVRANLGDKMQLTMLRNDGKFNAPEWRKDGGEFNSFHPYVQKSSRETSYSLNFSKVHPGSSGIYSLHFSNFKLRGVSRLIVRSCPAYTYGSLCESDCPRCQNGGVCHDVMGGCICPPGFNGTLCEKRCGDNTYGSECNLHCSDSNRDRERTCEGLLFCLPDPYGCSCATGFKGLNCTIPCSPGEFGADCEQKLDCHCSGEDTACNRFTGLCDQGCLPGWRGTSCSISYPYLADSPKILRGDARNVEIALIHWDGVTGEGNPLYYLVEIKINDPDRMEDTFREVEKVKYPPETKALSVNLDQLLPNTNYAVRVVLLDEDGQAQRDLAPYATFLTACGRPDSPPDDFAVDFTNPKAVHISWKFPDKSKWNCYAVSVGVEYNSSFRSNHEVLTDRENWEFGTDPYTAWQIAIRLQTPNGKLGEYTPSIYGTSAEDAPEGVQNLTLHYVSTNGTLEVTWEKPLILNGQLRSYKVDLYHLNFLHCESNNKIPPRYTEVSPDEERAELDNVRFSSSYRVHVTALTVKLGTLVFKDIQTEESVPSGSPQNLRDSKVRETQLMLDWVRPKCEETNGIVTSYALTRIGLDSWDKNMVNMTASVGVTSALWSALVPFTNYEFRVYACTKVGCGDSYAVLTNKTAPSSPLAPGNLTVYRTTMSTISLSWKEPYPPHGIIKRYLVEIKRKGSYSQLSLSLNASDIRCKESGKEGTFCYTESKLEKKKTYELKVYAFINKLRGPPAETEGETDESVPEAPEALNISKRTTAMFHVVWSPPKRENGEIIGYQVNCSLASDEEGLLSTRTTNFTSLEIFDLRPATIYKISVAARTSKGYGPNIIGNFSTKSPVIVIKETPELKGKLGNTVTLLIKPLDLGAVPMSAYFVLVKEVDKDKEVVRMKRCAYSGRPGRLRKRCAGDTGGDGDDKPPTPDQLLVNYNTSRELNLKTYTTGKLLASEVKPEGTKFVVGDGALYNGYYNAPLEKGRQYQIGVAVESSYVEDPQFCFRFSDEIVTVDDDTEQQMQKTSVTLVVGLSIICLLALVALLLFIYYKKPQLFHSIKDKANNSFHIMYNSKNGGPRSGLTDSVSSLNIYADCVIPSGLSSNRIPVSELEEFVRNALFSGQMVDEFKTLSKGQIHSNEVARLPENKQKNRYGNLLPYDHNRVVLEKKDNEPFSDYINASFLDGYKSPRRYLATQGPKPLTVVDFWRMVWQYNVCKIAMVTNVLESGKVKCEKYWPDTTDRYGQLTIQSTETNTFSNYVIRTFQVSKVDEEPREVTQFQFTTWPDHAVPMYPVAIGGFLKRLKAYKDDSNAPIVVHCSAGVGRTGTLILLDSMMDMALAEDAVDLYAQLWGMRQQRINQVENPEQYVFAYQTLAEVLCGVETSILSSDFYNEYPKLIKENPATGKSVIQEQLERLERVRQPLNITDCKAAQDPLNMEKNRDQSIVPPDRSRPVLPAYLPENTSNYINGVYVNGFKQRDAFVVTQYPLDNTVSDFWRMLKSTRTRTLVLLQDVPDKEAPYWPKEGSVEHGGLTVQTTSSHKEGDIVIRVFNIKGPDSKEEVTVKQFHLQCWPVEKDVPANTDILFDLIEKVERWQKQTGNKPITVQCLDGASACGVFCASVFVCDKIKAEHEVDVYLAVRSIRQNRTQFITNEVQYVFCHQMALTFLDSFETYANFQ